MILRRLTNALKEQNWTTILIEFFLLVSGVFLGIQPPTGTSNAPKTPRRRPTWPASASTWRRTCCRSSAAKPCGAR